MGGIGIAMFNLASLFEVLTVRNLIICTVVVFGGVFGSWLMGKVVKFYPVESAITAGLCMSNAGGNGDILCINQRKPDGTDAVCSNLFPNRGCDCSIYTECPRWNFAMIKM